MRRYWTTIEIRKLRSIYPDMENGAISAHLGRTLAAVKMMAVKLDLRKSQAFLAGPYCRFQRGRRPWNVGLKWDNPGGRATRFRKGHRGTRQKPVGAERVERDGVFVKVAEPNVWEAKARIVWRSHFGEIPPRHIVRLKDGNKLNCAPENLMLINRAENARLNSRVRKQRAKVLPSWTMPLGVSA